MFKLHVIQAQFGDSLLIEYGNSPSQFILIDGGPSGVYKQSLRHELERIVGDGGTLEAVMVSHIDIDHIKGVMDLLAELKSQKDNNKDYFLTIGQLWLNSFSDVIDTDGTLAERMNEVFSTAGAQNVNMEETAIAVNGVKEGDGVTRFCDILDIPMNPAAADGFFIAHTAQEEVKFSNLTFTITGPTQANLDELKKEWDKWLEKQEETIANGTFDILAMSDKSVPNLSSLTFLVEGDGKTILFTGDGRGDHLIQGLETKGLLDNGKLEVDILKVAHHGSNHNTDKAFFKKVIAATYVISANGKYDNPDYETLTWIVEAANEDGRQISIVVTNETDSTNQLLEDYPPGDWGYSLSFIPANKFSIEL